MQIAFLIAHLNMDHSRLDHNSLVLTEMLMSRDHVTGQQIFGSQHRVLGAVILRADL
jgi:hypothetical protein